MIDFLLEAIGYYLIAGVLALWVLYEVAVTEGDKR